jgi:TPR repeat protein
MRLAVLMTILLLLAMAPAYALKDDGFKGQGFKSDAACPEGVQGLRCHAEQGQANSQYEWGMMLLDGDGVERDHMQALKWLSRAAKQGHGTAGYILARLSLSSEPGGVCAR